MVDQYFKNHRNIYASKGMAYDHKCVDCNGMALDWSQVKDSDPSDPENYEPRCRTCHLKYDYTEERKIKVGKAHYTGAYTQRIIISDSELGRPGENNGRAILTETDVIEIRRLYSTGKYTQKQLAIEYNMSESGMRSVIKRENWKHLP